jgi:hypothetical protein
MKIFKEFIFYKDNEKVAPSILRCLGFIGCGLSSKQNDIIHGIVFLNFTFFFLFKYTCMYIILLH